ncbi:MAG TPA: wax ester/triacylglycerol synthase family O-acyltransferase [Pseudonocardia sp.]|nr:wax ester/triacylglycerol synthase family O-acyltransferase [Pseudonocardia sp.]
MVDMLLPMPVTDSMFLLAESREHPTHVGGLQLFRAPHDAAPGYLSDSYRELLTHTEISRTMRRRPVRSPLTLGQWAWEEDPDIELDYHVRLSALPSPGRVRELLELVSRLHGSLLDRHRPLWEFHLIEGLNDGRFATYVKVHHALMDGVSAVRTLSRGLTTDPSLPALPPWSPARRSGDSAGSSSSSGIPGLDSARSVVRGAVELVGAPPALGKAILGLVRDNGATGPFDAPRSMFNVPIGGARRFAGQSWSFPRIRAVAKAGDATVNDVAVAMCGGALRRYLIDQDALPEQSLVAMLPVSLRDASDSDRNISGNAVGAILCDLATDQDDAGVRLDRVSASTRSAKDMMRGMTVPEMLGLTSFLTGGLALAPIPGLGSRVRPPFNLIISNVPGSREVQYFNGAELLESYPLSIPADGQAVNITLTSYSDKIGFGIVGCRRTVPHLQRLLEYLEDALTGLERAAGLA